MKKALQIIKNLGELSNLFSQIKLSNAKIILKEDGEVINSDNEAADVLNTFLSVIVSNLNLPGYHISNLYYNKIRDPVLKAIVKYKDHPCIKVIKRVPKSKDFFKYSNVEKKEISQEIDCLDASKACQETNVPTLHPPINALLCPTS